ncbi:DNA mismatch repair endonuclease MutL [Empedobacter stercoris]|uniref:DNA mismatch repair endonuclease MutL n=1 Tax=Empedobacter TaxID=59734 RepID=UPI0021AF654F|nr:MULTISPECIES: DNA mismatch repair endonuclease MutL [Empedobacter]MDM1522214.1 DNA mismatch repair endonuclease MutL [Empedobacter sp. 225-1]MDM1542403.1 DNA mismatch repair endonuclease MutL [Empedobacter sp. 189-2]UWX66819.1 DNA mismatch repair endonuclease MutL [Empedobacter stercoris]
MNDIIQLLPDHVANQIAAGEVVQRPASVIKELIENAVDSGATSIQVIVKDAGRSLIQVIDNGSGMSVTDVRMAFERHATSKIRKTEDIYNIHTKGFRGEALASIAAVAQVETKTRRDEDEVGSQLVIEGGEVRSQDPVVCPVGTSIAVKNLFYNVPARRNFLKSNQVEFRHIQDEFQRVSMAHENISFFLHHNDAEIYHLKAGNLKQRITQIFGKKLSAQIISVEEDTEIVKVKGFVGKPDAAKKSRGEQFFFVNNRFIRSGYLHNAIVDAFESLLPTGYSPSYFLYLELDPSKIDINIHPTKTEIKFEDEALIYTILRAAVKHALGQFNVIPSLDFEQDPNWAFIPSATENTEIKMPEITVDSSFNPFEHQQTRSPKPSDIRANMDFYKDAVELEIENNHAHQLFESEDFQDSFDVIQWMNQYLIVEYRGELLIIDQHRAHQKILFEKFIHSNNGSALVQQMLFPIELELSPNDRQKLINVEHQLLSFGFDISLDEETIQINAIPVDVQQEDVVSIFMDFIEELEYQESIELENTFAKILAKNAAVKKGVALKSEQMQTLVEELLRLTNPNYTPYGRPIFVQMNTADIKKTLQ